jgi:hypothetical protein
MYILQITEIPTVNTLKIGKKGVTWWKKANLGPQMVKMVSRISTANTKIEKLQKSKKIKIQK